MAELVKTIETRISSEMMVTIDRMANESKMSRSKLVREALFSMLETIKPKDKE